MSVVIKSWRVLAAMAAALPSRFLGSFNNTRTYADPFIRAPQGGGQMKHSRGNLWSCESHGEVWRFVSRQRDGAGRPINNRGLFRCAGCGSYKRLPIKHMHEHDGKINFRRSDPRRIDFNQPAPAALELREAA